MTHPRERVQLHFAHQQVRDFLAKDTITYPDYDETRTLSARDGKIFHFGTTDEVQEMPDPLTYPMPATTMKTMDVVRAVIAKYTPDEDMEKVSDILEQRHQPANPFEPPKEYDPVRERMEGEEAERNNKRLESAQTLAAALTVIEGFAQERRLGAPPSKDVLESAL